MRKVIIAGGIAIASIISFLVLVGMPQITYEEQDPALSQKQVCDEQNNCSMIYTQEIESKPKLVFKPIYDFKQEIPEQQQTVVEDESAKFYDEPPVSYACEIINNSNLRCTFEDGSSSVQQIHTSDVSLVQSRLSYCNEIIQHRSVSLDKEPMLRCLFDNEE